MLRLQAAVKTAGGAEGVPWIKKTEAQSQTETGADANKKLAGGGGGGAQTVAAAAAASVTPPKPPTHLPTPSSVHGDANGVRWLRCDRNRPKAR